ncbi:MAG: sensor histidine kinase [Rhodospirillales bacterium]|jgi:signal transduction histidine kinase|nr:sensor histidine kinase [Rhodospirillales bacterium]
MRNLKARLILSAGLWISVILIVGGGALSYNFQRSLQDAFHHRIETFLNALIAATNVTENGKLKISRDLGDPRFNQILSGWYWQVSSQGTAIARSRSLWDQILAVNKMHNGTTQVDTFELKDPLNKDILVLQRALQIDHFDQPVYFLVAADISELQIENQTFNTILVVSLLCLGIGVLIALLVQVQFGLKPLRLLTQDIEAVRQNKSNELQENYPDEVLPLVNATNALLKENQEQIQRARHHVGNLAHALKTPLTILRVEAQKEIKQYNRETLLEQLETITNLVEHRLNRAAAAGASAYTSERVPVLNAIQPICQLLQKSQDQYQYQIKLDIPDDLIFLGERQDFEEMLGNLLENAFKWAGSTIQISTLIEAETISLQIYDDGPGMNPELMVKARTRGQRLDERKPGHGLGLSIVSDIVDSYHGHLTLEQGPSGGLLATLAFPIGRLQMCA